MGGRLGELVKEIADNFNKGQDKYTVVAVNKGNYSETLTAAMAAYLAGKGPTIVQAFEVGPATILAPKGAIVPVYQVTHDTGHKSAPPTYIQSLTARSEARRDGPAGVSS